MSPAAARPTTLPATGPIELVRAVPKLPARAAAAHKGTFGTVLVVAGSDGMLGAAILCARGALRGGAGLVQAALPAALQAPFTVAVPAAMTRRRSPMAGLRAAVAAAQCTVVGPGLGGGAAVRALVLAVLRAAQGPVVLDADALNALAPLRAPLPGAAAKVLLPHPGEAARLLGCDTKAVQAQRQRAAVELSRRSGAVAVLKGAGTLVCSGRRLFQNRTGNPGMATGGSGDVLAGLCGALLAQGMAPFDAARLAVHVHGRAGDLVARRLSPAGLCAEDLPLAVAEVLR
ncbi:MAG: NAD(P)H-hydrate dehydratase [Planctomycetota bacterium]